jgi:hypothetical protein
MFRCTFKIHKHGYLKYFQHIINFKNYLNLEKQVIKIMKNYKNKIVHKK